MRARTLSTTLGLTLAAGIAVATSSAALAIDVTADTPPVARNATVPAPPAPVKPVVPPKPVAGQVGPVKPVAAKRAAEKPAASQALLTGSTKASYFWDDASGRAGDTGMPAIGKPMQKGLFSSPSWPLGTEGYVTYKGKKAEFFIGDRGPGEPSDRGVMLDIDAKTFADLAGGEFNPDTLMVDGAGTGHINVSYTITKWGPGKGTKGEPKPFSTGAWAAASG
ncbi:hypothetical protein [Bailinhaonella thermotolerans]|uniref:hypothetical protein n=1 Tax=Bailinhaonella thermotolerans TaxID=1070861 RepID=UPI001F5B46C9|nr:hypothetical protein [Bailinhaonella thermotolerans]